MLRHLTLALLLMCVGCASQKSRPGETATTLKLLDLGGTEAARISIDLTKPGNDVKWTQISGEALSMRSPPQSAAVQGDGNLRMINLNANTADANHLLRLKRSDGKWQGTWTFSGFTGPRDRGTVEEVTP